MVASGFWGSRRHGQEVLQRAVEGPRGRGVVQHQKRVVEVIWAVGSSGLLGHLKVLIGGRLLDECTELGCTLSIYTQKHVVESVHNSSFWFVCLKMLKTVCLLSNIQTGCLRLKKWQFST